jgi:hypothetical protein
MLGPPNRPKLPAKHLDCCSKTLVHLVQAAVTESKPSEAAEAPAAHQETLWHSFNVHSPAQSNVCCCSHTHHNQDNIAFHTERIRQVTRLLIAGESLLRRAQTAHNRLPQHCASCSAHAFHC